MRRNNRREFNVDKESNKMIIISVSITLIAILAFVLTFFIYSNYLNKIDISDFEAYPITDLGTINNNEIIVLEEASSSIGKTVNEVEQSTNEIKETNKVNEEKVAINTTNMEKETTKQEENKVVNTKPKEEKIPDPTFKKPVDGEIVVNFAKDNLIYSNTLQEWVTHNGVDIKADKATVVKASEEGTIKTIKNDPRYGITVVVEHVNGYSTIYANLLTAEFVKENEKIKQGQTIGTVGNTATFEIAQDSHLHFEILKDGEYLDPTLYLK